LNVDNSQWLRTVTANAEVAACFLDCCHVGWNARYFSGAQSKQRYRSAMSRYSWGKEKEGLAADIRLFGQGT